MTSIATIAHLQRTNRDLLLLITSEDGGFSDEVKHLAMQHQRGILATEELARAVALRCHCGAVAEFTNGNGVDQCHRHYREER